VVRFSRLSVVILIGLIAPFIPALAQTCDQLNREIADARRTITEDNAALNNCGHPIVCSAGEMSRLTDAIHLAQHTIDIDERSSHLCASRRHRLTSITFRWKVSR